MFHQMKGTAFESGDQGVMRRLTQWEQLDGGEQFTAGKKFVIGFTILLYVRPHPQKKAASHTH